MTGTIIRIVDGKDFGFIRSRDTHADVFFHRTSLVETDLPFDSALLDKRVQFEVFDSPKGPRASNVRCAT